MNNLNKYRTKMDMSRAKLAGKVGKTEQYIGKLEREEHEPTLKLAYRIADALKKSVFTIWPK